jgi:hypothetical protein
VYRTYANGGIGMKRLIPVFLCVTVLLSGCGGGSRYNTNDPDYERDYYDPADEYYDVYLDRFLDQPPDELYNKIYKEAYNEIYDQAFQEGYDEGYNVGYDDALAGW